MIARVAVFAAIAVLCSSGCAYAGVQQSWSRSRAETDAEQDIAAKNIRFAYIGRAGIACTGLAGRSVLCDSALPETSRGAAGLCSGSELWSARGLCASLQQAHVAPRLS
jgi:hypothetical protein